MSNPIERGYVWVRRDALCKRCNCKIEAGEHKSGGLTIDRRRVLALRKRGLTAREIAERCGCAESSIWRLLAEAAD